MRETVKPESPETEALPQVSREGVDGRGGRQRRVKCRVEADHRWNAGEKPLDSSRGGERRRLVERCEIHQGLEAIEHRRIEKSRSRKESPAVHDAVTNGVEGSGRGDEPGQLVVTGRTGGHGLQVSRGEDAIFRIE